MVAVGGAKEPLVEGGVSKSRAVEIGSWVVLFCCCSITMSIINKKAVKAFPPVITLIMLQNFVSLILSIVVGNAAPPTSKAFAFKQPLTKAITLKWIPACALFTTMLVTSLETLSYTSVATAIVVRSLTPHFSAIFEIIFFKNYITLRTWGALMAILGGAILFIASNPETYPIVGYIWAVGNLLSASLYAVYVKFVINTIKPSTMDLVLYNNLMSLFLLLPFLFIMDNVTTIGADIAAVDGIGWMWIILSLVVAGTISFAGFGLAGAVTSTTATVCQHISKIVSMLVSFAVFSNPVVPLQWCAVAISFAATAWYSYERMQNGKKGAAPKGILKSEDSSLLPGESKSKPCGGCIPWV